MSPVFFSIYIADLSDRLDQGEHGFSLTTQTMINYILFADDLLIISGTKNGLIILLSILNSWCRDFKMKISESKSKVVTSAEDVGGPSFEEEDGHALTLEKATTTRILE